MVYGSRQRALYSKTETVSPTISNDTLLTTMLVDAWENRDVATADITGAYLHADLLDYTLLKLEGEAVDIMCKLNGSYENFV